jgi:hypothetical protein
MPAFHIVWDDTFGTRSENKVGIVFRGTAVVGSIEYYWPQETFTVKIHHFYHTDKWPVQFDTREAAKQFIAQHL